LRPLTVLSKETLGSFVCSNFDGVKGLAGEVIQCVEQTGRPGLLAMGRVAPIPRKKHPMDPHERPVVTDDNKVAIRAGSTGNHVRYVLIASTALVIVAFIAIALFVK
jgi:hypothetical protein